ncbi:MAG: TolC family protein [Bacteroidia bacterium]|nr:TolC family protein [Bacteroidia bacterium]
MSQRRFFSISLLLTLCLSGVLFLESRAQQRDPITLSRCIALAQSQSPEAQIAKKGLASIHWDYKSFRAGLLPAVRADFNTPGLLRSIRQVTQNDGTIAFRQQNQAFSSGTLSISQQIAPTGGSIFVSSGLTRLDVFGTNAYRLYQATPLLVGLNQPIFSFNALRWQQKIRPVQYQLAERRYLEALEDVALSITGKYFDVYIAEMSLKNAQFNLSITDSVFTISEGRFRVGKIAENDLLQTELAFLNAQVQTQQAQVSLQKAKLELAISLGLPNNADISVEQPEELPLIEIDQEFALNEAKQNRSDLLDFESRGLQAESSVAQARANARLNANLSATFGINNSDTTIAGSFQNLAEQETASIGIGIPIFQWGKARADVQSAALQRDQVQEQIRLDQRRFERDLRFQVMDFLQAQQQLQLASKSDTIAQRRFEVAKNRYLIGKIDITNLQIAQNEKDMARLSYFQALRQYWVAYYQLRRASLYDFVKAEKVTMPEMEF